MNIDIHDPPPELFIFPLIESNSSAKYLSLHFVHKSDDFMDMDLHALTSVGAGYKNLTCHCHPGEACSKEEGKTPEAMVLYDNANVPK